MIIFIHSNHCIIFDAYRSIFFSSFVFIVHSNDNSNHNLFCLSHCVCVCLCLNIFIRLLCLWQPVVFFTFILFRFFFFHSFFFWISISVFEINSKQKMCLHLNRYFIVNVFFFVSYNQNKKSYTMFPSIDLLYDLNFVQK